MSTGYGTPVISVLEGMGRDKKGEGKGQERGGEGKGQERGGESKVYYITLCCQTRKYNSLTVDKTRWKYSSSIFISIYPFNQR